MKIFCLIPAFNEKGNLKILTEKLVPVLNKVCRKYKIYFVIQGKDGSKKEAEDLIKKFKNVAFEYYPDALGIGRAYRMGFQRTAKDYSHVLTMDADLNHDPEFLPVFIDKMKHENADIVIGSRFIKGGAFCDKRAWKKIISLTVNKIIILITGIKVHDISSGYRLMKREVIDKVGNKLRENGYPNYMELIIKSKRSGFRIIEVPIVYKPRILGKSKMGKIKTMCDYLLFLPKIIMNS